MLIERTAVRALLLTPDNEVLLIRIRSPEGKVFWIAPGGGIEPEETVEEALWRELNEELGSADYRIGPVVWLRHHTFDWEGARYSQHEQYRIVHVDKFDAAVLDEQEAAFATDIRWWRIDELPHATETFTPTALAKIMRDFVMNGAPYPVPPEEVILD
uniref:NUDIX hydrolase n=1 Tax=Altererythrobacter segetis TaxID=1104773 RepID=UPI0024341268|nr:NUDIX domain-containing protein [Altererythrobacter segetis]